ncbi:MAG: dihydrolipoyl dehydrogenase [Chloroflexi bacterium]|nr:dihydrolipoyl dehydrogenase [Chloroflexota bacterium]
MRQADIAIIGAGPGGYVAALRAAQLGAKVICIEKDRLGGVCLNWGCIPTKALLHCAEVFREVERAPRFGVRVGEVSFDWRAAQAHKERVVAQMTSGVEKLLARAGVEILRGEAHFLRANALEVRLADGRETVSAETILIATGSRPLQVPIPGLDDPGILDSTAALALEALPQSLCIIGSGAIGTEFASLFATLGVRVALVEMMPRLVPQMDASIGEGLAWSLSNQGVEVRTSTRVTRVERIAEGYLVHIEGPDGEARLEAEKVLSAIGRTPDVEHLGLEAIGLRPTRQGIRVDDSMRTAVPGVYAIGDVAAEGPMLAHVAMHQGVVAVEHALGLGSRMDYRAVPSCIYSLPEAASVGLTEEQARSAGYDVRVGLFALANNGKAAAMGEMDGFAKVVAEGKYGAILGVHIVGPHASDLIMEGTLAVGLEATWGELERAIHPHPALSEALAEAVLAAQGRALHVPK